MNNKIVFINQYRKLECNSPIVELCWFIGATYANNKTKAFLRMEILFKDMARISFSTDKSEIPDMENDLAEQANQYLLNGGVGEKNKFTA